MNAYQETGCPMHCRIVDLRCKEVISVSDGSRLGYVSDVEIDTCTGRMVAIVVPGHSKGLNIFAKKNDYIIPWDAIRRIGDDIILTTYCPPDSISAPQLWQNRADGT